MKTDVSFAINGMFVSIYPNTPNGESLVRQFMDQNEGTNKIFSPHWPSVKASIKAAGYTVRKQKAAKPMSSAELDDLFEALEA